MLFENLWQDYIHLTPDALKIHQLLSERGEKIINDHVAFRTFNTDKLKVSRLAQHFEAHGYQQQGEYDFPQKKLKAFHYQHKDPNLPKVFISQLLLEECSTWLQKTVKKLLSEGKTPQTAKESFLTSGRSWKLSHQTYQKLYQESEYAAWLAAFGIRVNHFTVSFNHLRTFQDLVELNQLLKDQGFKLNASGGEIKGTPTDLLEQSSTMAGSLEVDFTDQTISIPSCYYEFARRYPLPSGNLFQGFIATSADKIFESTHQT